MISVQGSVEANDAFKILQRRLEEGITFKQFEAEYAAFFIRFVLSHVSQNFYRKLKIFG